MSESSAAGGGELGTKDSQAAKVPFAFTSPALLYLPRSCSAHTVLVSPKHSYDTHFLEGFVRAVILVFVVAV